MKKQFMTHDVVRMLTMGMYQAIMNDLRGLDSATRIRVYGVPRGGVPVAYCLKAINPKLFEIVEMPEGADIFIDDIIDSGSTEAEYLGKYDAEGFYALLHPGNKTNNVWYVFPWEQGRSDTSADDIVTRTLQRIGEDPGRDGLLDTPKRVVKSWDEIYAGYQMDPVEILSTRFDNEEKYNQMVLLKNIDFYSMCEHHMLPFFGKVHIGYLPKDKVVGISKLSRLVDCFSRRLQIQERMTQQIANAIQQELDPMGVAVICEAQHLCMVMRGVKKMNAYMTTSALKGVYEDDTSARQEFLMLVQRDGGRL